MQFAYLFLGSIFIEAENEHYKVDLNLDAVMLWEYILMLLHFLNEYSGTIVAVATMLSVLVAALYTFYTTRLWKVSAEQALSMEAQVAVTQRHLELLEQQMVFTEKTFEALHRPRLMITTQFGSDFRVRKDNDAVPALMIAVKNYGVTSATILSTECKMTEGEGSVWLPRMPPLIVPTGEAIAIGHLVLPITPKGYFTFTEESLRKTIRFIHVYVKYKGLGEIYYVAQAQISLLPDFNDSSKWCLMGITPTGPEFREAHNLSV